MRRGTKGFLLILALRSEYRCFLKTLSLHKCLYFLKDSVILESITILFIKLSRLPLVSWESDYILDVTIIGVLLIYSTRFLHYPTEKSLKVEWLHHI